MWAQQARETKGKAETETSNVSSKEIIETLWEFLKTGVAIKESVNDDKIVEDASKNEEDKIEVNADASKDAESKATNKGAGQLAREFFKILHESVSFKKDEYKNEPLSDDAAEATDDDICENVEEKRNFDRKISTIVEYFFNMVKSPKIDGAERVRRKSSCFWSEQSPSDYGSRQETFEETSPEVDNCRDDDKLQSFKEFIMSSDSPKRDSVAKSPKKPMDVQKNTRVKIQRKIFSKRSSSSEERQSLLDFFFDYRGEKRRRESSSSKLSLKKQKSLEENSTKTVRISDAVEIASTSGERRTSLVDLIFKNEKSVNFCSLLRRFSQDSSEICFIDQSPESKTKDTFVELVFKCMDSFDSYVDPLIARRESMPKNDSVSKLNMLFDSKAAIAKPENFELTPESDKTIDLLQIKPKPTLKDMGTSCDISDSQFSMESDITPESCIEDEYWISPETLEELKRCAEVIFNEVQGQQHNSRVAGISMDICDANDCPECIAEAKATNKEENSKQMDTNEIGCDQCRVEAILEEEIAAAKLAARSKLYGTAALETNFDYDPTVEDSQVHVMDTLAVPYSRELGMINESFEQEESP